MKKLFFITVTCLISNFVYAQGDIAKERDKLHDLFFNSISRTHFKDTNMVYLFSVKVVVAKGNEGKYRIQSIKASDSSAYLIYKNFDFLKEVNYSLFTKNQSKATFVFPVAIFLTYPDKPKTGLLHMDEVFKKLNSYWFIKDYDNTTYENIYYPPLILMTSTVVDY